MKNCPTCHLTYPDDFTLCPHDGGRLESKDDWAPGTIVREKYRIIGPIGAGGMATVYKAEHIHFREVRALKVISTQLSGDPSFVRRFMQEAVLTRRLQHPHAVRVEDIDRGDDGRPFIVMEFIDGITLREAMRPQVPMPVERACRIARQVASALGTAHDLGMVHRDIKPTNIFLANTYSPTTKSVDGEQAKVLDFGIAKMKESQIHDTRLRNITLTGAGVYIGTPAYMSPEQAAGKRGDDLDGRADLYSLGIVLYQMLTGDLPLNADSEMQLMMAHLATEPVPIQQRLPHIPQPLAYLVMRCLAKEPSLRPATAQAFVAEIEEIERSLADPLPAVPPALPPAATPQPQRTPFFTTTKIAVLVAMLVCALALGAFSVVSHFHNLSEAKAAQMLSTPRVSAPAVHPPAPTDTTLPQAESPAQENNTDAAARTPIQTSPPAVPSNRSLVRTRPPTEPLQSPDPAPEESPEPAQKQPLAAASDAGSNPTESPGNAGSPLPSNSKTGNPSSYPPLGNPMPNPMNQANNPYNNPSGNPLNNPLNNPGNRQGGDILRPAVVSKVEPKYSQEAKSFRYSGTSVLSVVVDERGIPGDIRVLRQAGYGLDKQAAEAVSRWRFSPGLRNGVPIRYRLGVQVNFRYAGVFSFARSSLFFQ